MAIATATCTCRECGTTFKHRKECRNRSDADDYTAWAETHITICPDCYWAEQKAKEIRNIEEEAATLNLPDLVGSEKQITWAIKIRHDLLREAKAYKFSVPKVRKIIAAGKEAEYLDAIQQNKEKHPHAMRLAMAVYKATTETSAKWWIDNR